MSGNVSVRILNEENNTGKPCKVFVCTSAVQPNVQGFIDEFNHRFGTIHADAHYFQLPYSGIDRFSVKGNGMDVMILCHSIDNRRFSITDVMDALYTKFLPNAAKTLGKQNVCVIVHDFPPKKKLEKPDQYMAEMESFKTKQGTTFKNAALVMMCGKLDGPVEMQESNWDDLKQFLQNAVKKRQIPKGCGGTTSMKVNKLSILVSVLSLIIFFMSLAGVIYCIVEVKNSLPAATTTKLPPSTTRHPQTTLPSTTDTPATSQGTSHPAPTTVTSSDLTTDSTTINGTNEITSPTTITDTPSYSQIINQTLSGLT
ncbi:uncharacterized protein LOC100890563 [Strongylocentrotus purpuratus]|uniref:Uncharacterized protein n=1 Tax=Strongylocentrotus purpuratus TaxID=7668 RepID=A0A7M7LLL7_STRPU|nr:uncharacterized protein LOC100890563 [Strongylocentrotus purpuratus]